MVRQPGAKGSLSHRMFVALVVACTSVAVVVTVAASLIYQSAFLADEHEQLAGECRTIASLLNLADDDPAVLSELDLGDIRATLIDPDGTVTYDSLAPADELPNHGDRPEVVAAFAEGSGSSERSSDTAGYMSLYEAERLESGQVVRLSVDRAGVVAFWSRTWSFSPCSPWCWWARAGSSRAGCRVASSSPSWRSTRPWATAWLPMRSSIRW